MQWRMRLSEQLYRSTDKAFGFKNKLVYVEIVISYVQILRDMGFSDELEIISVYSVCYSP